MFFSAPKGGLRAGHLLEVYTGESTDSLEISYREALARWAYSDYVFSDSDHFFVVNGALTCPATRANESFGETNAKLVFNSKWRRAELRLGAPVRKGLYEGLINYTAPHLISPYWTEDKLVSLPPSTQKQAREPKEQLRKIRWKAERNPWGEHQGEVPQTPFQYCAIKEK